MGSWENSRFIQVHEIIEREIMGEINQVVPNLIAESISGRKKIKMERYRGRYTSLVMYLALDHH